MRGPMGILIKRMVAKEDSAGIARLRTGSICCKWMCDCAGGTGAVSHAPVRRAIASPLTTLSDWTIPSCLCVLVLGARGKALEFLTDFLHPSWRERQVRFPSDGSPFGRGTLPVKSTWNLPGGLGELPTRIGPAARLPGRPSVCPTLSLVPVQRAP